MTEKKTFDKLRRLPLREVKERLYKDRIAIPPTFRLGHGTFEKKDFFDDVHYYIETINILQDCGWDPIDFYKELEKEMIISMVKEYNASLEIPNQILERAKKSFPNIKFTPARIDFE